jgi:serine/threonine-protein kinase CTR1
VCLRAIATDTLPCRQLRHPNIVLFLGCCHDPTNNSLSIVTEFLERGSLSDVLADKSIQIETPLLLRFAIDAALGMNYLHNRKPPIIHRDLKSANLLVDRYFNVKVSDFGLAKRGLVPGLMRATTFCGTIPWLAPEVCCTCCMSSNQ